VELLLAVVAAMLYGCGAVLQARGARRAFGRTTSALGPVREPVYLLGVCCDLTAWLFAIGALRTQPLFAVQPILAGSVAATTVLSRIVERTTLDRSTSRALVAVLVGLVFVGLSAGGEGRTTTTIVGVEVLFGCLVLVVALGLFTARRGIPVVVGVASGLAFSGSALSARLVPAPDRVVDLLGEPLVWAIPLFAGTGMLLLARAMALGRTGPVQASMWATNAIVPSVVGVVWLGDTVRSAWQVPAVVGVAVAVAGTVRLALDRTADDVARSDTRDLAGWEQ
jgi:hypothetical protein